MRDVPCTGLGKESVLPGVSVTRPGALAGLLGGCPSGTHRSWFLKGLGHGVAAGETTSARVGAHYPPPDAIGGALAACLSWGNLPRGCITPARFATEVEPSQSAGELGPGRAAQLPTQRAARLTGK